MSLVESTEPWPGELDAWQPPRQEAPIPRATRAERQQLVYGLEVSFDVEESYVEERDEWSRHRVRVSCPSCSRTVAPLLSPHTRVLETGWTWMGLEYRYPYTDFVCRCRRCRAVFRLHLWCPQ